MEFRLRSSVRSKSINRSRSAVPKDLSSSAAGRQFKSQFSPPPESRRWRTQSEDAMGASGPARHTSLPNRIIRAVARHLTSRRSCGATRDPARISNAEVPNRAPRVRGDAQFGGCASRLRQALAPTRRFGPESEHARVDAACHAARVLRHELAQRRIHGACHPEQPAAGFGADRQPAEKYQDADAGCGGKQDQLITVEAAERYASGIAGAKLVTYDKCGHVPPQEHTGEFVKAVSELLQ
jgi:pimeloyl-ACP methyl ester carboxylesterase